MGRVYFNEMNFTAADYKVKGSGADQPERALLGAGPPEEPSWAEGSRARPQTFKELPCGAGTRLWSTPKGLDSGQALKGRTRPGRCSGQADSA